MGFCSSCLFFSLYIFPSVLWPRAYTTTWIHFSALQFNSWRASVSHLTPFSSQLLLYLSSQLLSLWRAVIVLITSCFCLSHKTANFLSKDQFLIRVNAAPSMLRSWQLAKLNKTPWLPYPPLSKQTPKCCLITYYNFLLQYLPASFYVKEGSQSYSKTEGRFHASTTKLYSTSACSANPVVVCIQWRKLCSAGVTIHVPEESSRETAFALKQVQDQWLWVILKDDPIWVFCTKAGCIF